MKPQGMFHPKVEKTKSMKPRRHRKSPGPQELSPQVPFMERRGTVLLAAVSLFLFVFFLYAGPAWVAAVYRLIVDGSLAVLWFTAMLGAGAWLWKVFGLGDEPVGIATTAGLGIGAFSLLTLGLGLAGWLNRGLAIVLIGIGIALLLVRFLGDSRPKTFALSVRLQERVDWTSWLWLIVVPFFAIAVLGALMPPGVLWPTEPHFYDVLEYHLQVPREWYQAGRIIPLHHNVFSYFPFNVEVHYLLAMHLRGGPWAGMYLAQLMHVAMIALSVAAVAEFVGRKGFVGVLMAASTPWLTMLAPVAYNEGGLLLFGTLAIGWTARAIATSETRSRLMALAGVMAGFACGVKLTAVPMLLAAIPVGFVIASLVRGQRQFLRPVALFVLCGLVVFSPWLIRNFVWTHNPVFPEAMSILGRAHFTPEQVDRWRMAYVPPATERSFEARIRASWIQIFADWRYGFVLIPAGLFVIVRGGKWRDTAFAASLLLMWLVFWLFFTHLQSRFFVLAIPVLAMLTAQIQTPILKWAAVCGVLFQAGTGLLNLHTKEIGNRLEFCLPMDTYPTPPDAIKVIEAGRDLCLIGEAKAFAYEMPMSRLHYRTVFDVDLHGRDPVDAWFEGCSRNAGTSILIDYAELHRFARTYFGITPPGSEEIGRVMVNVDGTK